MKTLRVSGFMRIVMGISVVLLFSGCREAKFVKRTSADPDKQARLNWSYRTSVEVYQKSSFKGYRWNNYAINALAEFACVRSGVFTNNEPCSEIISSNAAAAIRAGCKDPMVNYLFIKYAMSQTNSKEAFTKAYCETAKAINNSSYPAIRKFYAAGRALQQIQYDFGTNSSSKPVTQEILALINVNITDTLADKNMPAVEAYEAADLAMNLAAGGSEVLEQNYGFFEGVLFNNWPDAYTTWLWKGGANITRAWNARGTDTADKVTEQGWKLFGERLATAQEALEHAWTLNPKDPAIALQMMTVMLGQGGGRDRMELWFNRAMEVDTNCYDACQKKLYYLEPKWYGSDEAQLAFGRECVRSTQWGGRVPLALLDAHLYINARNPPAEQTNYWRQAEVWADVQAAFEHFFELNPEATSWYHNYAWCAYHAQRWKKLNELLPKLGPVNYEYFGGKDEYELMVKLAAEHINDK